MAQTKKTKIPSGGSRRRVAIAVAVGLLLVVGLGIYLWVRSTGKSAAAAASDATADQVLTTKVILPAIPRRPRPVALPAEQFTDPAIRKSYEVARNNPELLEQMACYCGCYSNPGHTNNLDCFVDKHGET